MSATGSLDRRDWQSVARHALLTLIADAITAALDASLSLLITGTIDPMAMAKRVGLVTLTSILAGAMRMAQRWRLQLDPQTAAMPAPSSRQE